MRSREKLLSYWRDPDDGVNIPRSYLSHRCQQRTKTLVGIFERLPISKDARILEVGCNIGRNLEGLRRAGYFKLWGVEINAEAVEIMKTQYPELNHSKVRVAAIEDVIEDGVTDFFDVVFTMAVLQHIHPKSKFVFAEMVRITKYLITIEDEHTRSWRHKPRDYGRVFSKLGMVQIGKGAIKGLSSNFVCRAFRKEV